jgi:DNA-binding SARP family transcriptional activator
MRDRRLDDLVTAGLLVGVPLALWSVAGVPELGAALNVDHLVGWAVLGAWAAWAWCLTGVIVDVIRMVRAADVGLGSSRGPLPRLAARLAGLVLALGSIATPAAASPTGAETARPPLTAPVIQPRSVAPLAPAAPAPSSLAPSSWTVSAGDCLWTIAERIEGDGEAWRLLADANLGHVMPDGRIFTDPSLIYPGWVLTVPATMASGGPVIDPVQPIPEANTTLDPPSDPPATTTLRGEAGAVTAVAFSDVAVVASGVLGVSALAVGLLRRRRGRRDRTEEISDELLDAEVLLEQSGHVPTLSMTEAALLLAEADGMLSDACLLSVGSDGARLFVGGSQVWHAAPIDLVTTIPDLPRPPAALVPLGDRDGESWALVVPPGRTGTIGGNRAGDLVGLALSLQGELAWGHRVRVVDRREELDTLAALHDGLLVSGNPALDDHRLAVLRVDDRDPQVHSSPEGVRIADLGLEIPMTGPLPVVADLLDEPARHETTTAGSGGPTIEQLAGTPAQTATSPMVRVLAASPRLDGLAQPIEAKRARRAVEVVAYLALHDPEPVTGDRIRTRVLGSSSQDAAAKTLFNVTSAARKGLGLTQDGEPVLPVADRTGCYRLGSTLTSDVAELHAHLACARRSGDGDTQMAHLRAALELVEGEPLAATLSGWDWFTVEGHRARLEAAVEDAATWLIDLALDAGLPDLAQLALDHARPVLALSEPLAARAMEVAAAGGSLRDLQRSFDDLGDILDELDPGCWPVAVHEERFRALAASLRASRDQASFAAMEAAPRSTSPSAPAAL